MHRNVVISPGRIRVKKINPGMNLKENYQNLNFSFKKDISNCDVAK